MIKIKLSLFQLNKPVLTRFVVKYNPVNLYKEEDQTEVGDAN